NSQNNSGRPRSFFCGRYTWVMAVGVEVKSGVIRIHSLGQQARRFLRLPETRPGVVPVSGIASPPILYPTTAPREGSSGARFLERSSRVSESLTSVGVEHGERPSLFLSTESADESTSRLATTLGFFRHATRDRAIAGTALRRCRTARSSRQSPNC